MHVCVCVHVNVADYVSDCVILKVHGCMSVSHLSVCVCELMRLHVYVCALVCVCVCVYQ